MIRFKSIKKRTLILIFILYLTVLPLPLILTSGGIMFVASFILDNVDIILLIVLLPLALALIAISVVMFYLGKIPALLIHLIFPAIDLINIANRIATTVGLDSDYFDLSLFGIF